MRVHLLDGTYELFRHFFAVPKHETSDGRQVGAIRGVLGSVLGMFEGGVTHLGVATDHIIESFRNDLWPGYKTSEGVEPELLAQFHPLEEALRALGVTVWAMTDLEADDALASAAKLASADPHVEQVLICTPDKDVAQSVVERHVVQFDRRKREMRDEAGVVKRFGVKPHSIPDFLALSGDSSDGFPGLHGWGPKSAATLLARYERIEDIPESWRSWKVSIRGADRLSKTLNEGRDLALLFKDLATLRADEALFKSVDELRWSGPLDEFSDVAVALDAEELVQRAQSAPRQRA